MLKFFIYYKQQWDQFSTYLQHSSHISDMYVLQIQGVTVMTVNTVSQYSCVYTQLCKKKKKNPQERRNHQLWPANKYLLLPCWWHLPSVGLERAQVCFTTRKSVSPLISNHVYTYCGLFLAHIFWEEF